MMMGNSTVEEEVGQDEASTVRYLFTRMEPLARKPNNANPPCQSESGIVRCAAWTDTNREWSVIPVHPHQTLLVTSP